MNYVTTDREYLQELLEMVEEAGWGDRPLVVVIRDYLAETKDNHAALEGEIARLRNGIKELEKDLIGLAYHQSLVPGFIHSDPIATRLRALIGGEG